MRKILLSIAVTAAFLSSSNLAQADGDTQRPTIWGGFYTGAHIGWGSVDANVAKPDLEDISGKCRWLDSGGLLDAVSEMRKVVGKKVDGKRYKRSLNRYLKYSRHRNHECRGISSYDSSTKDGALGGVHAGYNIQRGSLVFGVEGDYTKTTSEINTLSGYSIVDVSHRRDKVLAAGTRETNTEIDSIATIRGRLGWAKDKTLLYVTGGAAWAELDSTETINYKRRGKRRLTETNSSSENVMGYVIGAGAEHMIAQGFSLKGEVLHYDFDDKGFDFNTTSVRAGFSLHLN
ncbi:MAG: outer membrane protein [Methyloligellaceae bacterium]